MVALCRDHAAEIAAVPTPLAVALVRSAIAAATRALRAGDTAMKADALSTLRYLLACPPLRGAAMKASRLKSLAISAIEAALPNSAGSQETRADNAAAAVLQVLQGVGVDITSAGLLEAGATPLVSALQCPFVGAAQALLDAGADVNGLSRDGLRWPLLGAAVARSDADAA
jgi:hypothetical protein